MARSKVDYIKVNYKSYEIEIELRNKITILTGLSATGKTKLLELIQAISDLDKTGIVETSQEIIPLGPRNIGPFLDNKIYLMDELKPNTATTFNKNIKQCKSKFVIVTRDTLYNLNYGAYDIYEIYKEKLAIKAKLKYKTGIEWG